MHDDAASRKVLPRGTPNLFGLSPVKAWLAVSFCAACASTAAVRVDALIIKTAQAKLLIVGFGEDLHNVHELAAPPLITVKKDLVGTRRDHVSDEDI